MPLMTENDGKPADEELVIVETPPGGTPGGADDDGADDERQLQRDVEAEHPGTTDAEREAIRERRRLEKAERKERRDKAINRDKLELEFLRKRNDDLERRLSGVEQHAHQTNLSQLDAQIARAQNDAELAEKVIAKAVAAGNGDDVTQAMRYRDEAMQRAQQLSAAKHQFAQQRPSASAPPSADDPATVYAKEFISENPWYDLHGRDEDSAIILAIDQTILREGYKPDTAEYWDELRARAARRLPDRFKPEGGYGEQSRSAPAPRAARGGPALGSGKEHAPTSTRTEVYLSPERKQALIDAGVWDDPVLRMKYAKRYAEYDRAKRS